ncbi:MAG TPA: tol-pal system-associated acyl-CoA thioesterase [Gammaproteobacteria bacterium]|nr:tol-pal system-associated acyl-CoA thioesterase [Gammaproteobacteria bacterium]
MERVKRATGHVSSRLGDIKSTHAGFTWKVRVYYEDTDLGGVVYHANYLRFMERARTEWLRSLGFEQDVLKHHHSVQFVVVDAQLSFRKPARFNEELEVSVRVGRSGRASLLFHQEIHGPGGAGLCTGEIRVACIDSDTFKPRPLPREILRELAG